MTTVFNAEEARQVLKREQARNKVPHALGMCGVLAREGLLQGRESRELRHLLRRFFLFILLKAES